MIKISTKNVKSILLKKKLEDLEVEIDILEKGILVYFLKQSEIELKKFTLSDLTYLNEDVKSVVNILYSENIKSNIENLIDLFELLLHINESDVTGIVFTPRYIADFIVSRNLGAISEYNRDLKIIDPSCGCGIFLISAIDFLKDKFNVSIKDIIENNIFGIDVVNDNIRRTKFVLEYYLLKNNISFNELKNINIKSYNSLKTDWSKLFNVEKFTNIIGNPPYLNTHEINRDKIKYLKENYKTTQKGSFNIFYAFIEKGMNELSSDGLMTYILPNNYLTIKSAKELRSYLQKNNYIKEIIDFKDNMIFKPVRTYNCICSFSKTKSDDIQYAVLQKSKNLPFEIENIEFKKMNSNKLDNERWVISDEKTLNNISKIESQPYKIKDLIKTGIATLKDEVFLVEEKEGQYIKRYNKKEYVIDSDMVMSLYKISDIKEDKTLNEVKKYIIFPYIIENNKVRIIDEEVLSDKYPDTYRYLLDRKKDLDMRDKGRPNRVAWYAYGRSQGLNYFGRKLLFPTFSNVPKFTLVEDQESLICNGYSIIDSEYISLAVLQKILNSEVMNYYVKNTSYTIEGGYYCYQKKFIQNFSIPYLSTEDMNNILKMDKKELNKFLFKKYNLES